MATVSLIKNPERKRSTICKKNQNQIIMEFTPLIKYLANKMTARTHYTVELDEMISYGVLGLIDAIDKYDKKRKNEFKTYAEFRIRGAMLDYMREEDPVSRSVRDKIKLVEKAQRELEDKLKRKPTAKEMAKKLKVSMNGYFEMTNYARPVAFLRIEDGSSKNSDNNIINSIELKDEDEGSNPFDVASNCSIKKLMANAMAALNEKERSVISLHYYNDMNFRDIGKTIGVSESRVCQLHSSAISRLKGVLGKFEEDLF